MARELALKVRKFSRLQDLQGSPGTQDHQVWTRVQQRWNVTGTRPDPEHLGYPTGIVERSGASTSVGSWVSLNQVWFPVLMNQEHLLLQCGHLRLRKSGELERDAAVVGGHAAWSVRRRGGSPASLQNIRCSYTLQDLRVDRRPLTFPPDLSRVNTPAVSFPRLRFLGGVWWYLGNHQLDLRLFNRPHHFQQGIPAAENCREWPISLEPAVTKGCDPWR